MENALAKTIAYKEDGFGSTVNGVYDIKKFWQQNGIDSSALNISDGSGFHRKIALQLLQW